MKILLWILILIFTYSQVYGDEIEKGCYLRLLQTVDVLKSNNDAPSACSEKEKNVKIMQLTFDDELSKDIKNVTKLKNKFQLQGYLFHRLSGHNHSRVLMHVNMIEETNL